MRYGMPEAGSAHGLDVLLARSFSLKIDLCPHVMPLRGVFAWLAYSVQRGGYVAEFASARNKKCRQGLVEVVGL